MNREKVNRICIIGASITFVITVTLNFVGIPFYITGHLILPWVIAMLANNSLNKQK